MAVLLGHDHGHGHIQDQSHNHHDHNSHRHRHACGLPYIPIVTRSAQETRSMVMLARKIWSNHCPRDKEHGHACEEDMVEPLLKKNFQVKNKPSSEKEEKKKRNINVQGAYLHVLGDSIQSVGVNDWRSIDLVQTHMEDN